LDLLRDAFQSLRRNRISVLAYFLGSAAIVTVYRGVLQTLRNHSVMDPPPPWLAIVTIGADVLLAAAVSALQAVLFAQIGKEIDRPLWKCNGSRDALQRFFMPWFIINLLMLMLIKLQFQAVQAANNEIALLVEFFQLALFLLFIPLGACVMYAGRLNWRELPENLLPVARVYPPMLFVFLLGAAQYIYHRAVFLLLPAPLLESLLVSAFLDVPPLLADCLTFAAMWRVCMLYRDMAPEDTDYFNW